MEIKVLDHFPRVLINRENVLNSMDCHRESPVYEEVLLEYEKLESWLYAHVRPGAVMAWEPGQPGLMERLTGPGYENTMDTMSEGTGLLYVVMTLGKSLENYSSQLFEEGEYLSGMLLSAMADEYLFRLEDHIMPEIKAFCAVPGFGVLHRMEAPADIPLEFHQYVYESCGLKGLLDMDLSTGYMFDPVKTSCLVFLLSDKPSVFNAWHDCSRCPAINCRRRLAAKGSAGK